MKKKMLFMGDSLTAGVYSDGRLRYDRVNYPQMIATILEKRGELSSYYNVAVSGFTISDVYEQIMNNLTYNENVAYNIVDEHCYKKGLKDYHHTAKLLKHDIKIVDLIKEADEIVMTLGSNDFLKFFDRYRERIGSIIQNKKEETIMDRTVNEVLNNYYKLIDIIYALNPTVQIIILGSYVPNKSQTIQNALFDIFNHLELNISGALIEKYPQLKYIRVMEGFKLNAENFLDNPVNIHPNKLGYAYYAKRYQQEHLGGIIGTNN